MWASSGSQVSNASKLDSATMSPLAQQDVAKNAEGAEKKGEERAIEI
jgi:hypothetical protein